MEKKLNEFTEIELKALAYDTLAHLQNAQKNLQLINAELESRRNSPNKAPVTAEDIKGHPHVGTTEVV